MKMNEVVEKLKDILDYYTRDGDGLDASEKQALTEAIRCMELQIPKEPFCTVSTDEDGFKHATLHCPNEGCDGVVGWAEDEDDDGILRFNSENYCADCGQRIKAKGES